MELSMVEIEAYDWRKELWKRRSRGTRVVEIRALKSFLASSSSGDLKRGFWRWVPGEAGSLVSWESLDSFFLGK